MRVAYKFRVETTSVGFAVLLSSGGRGAGGTIFTVKKGVFIVKN
jgi:hypothetical protein